jgi:secretion/DNA translocation related TadE-like protein
MFQKGGVMKGDRGSGTVLAIAVVTLSVGCLAISQTVAFNLLAQARVEALADSVAVAADDALRGLTTGYPCEVARQIAERDMAILDECRIVGLEAFVNLHLQGMGIVLNASARAGPSS